MRKRILATILLVLALSLVGCETTSTTYSEQDNENFWNEFVIIEKKDNDAYGTLSITYQKDSKVMYYIYNSAYQGGITPIYNADGTVKIYSEDE